MVWDERWDESVGWGYAQNRSEDRERAREKKVRKERGMEPRSSEYL